MASYTDDGTTIVIQLNLGENIREKIEELAKKLDLQGASISGIGAVRDPEVAYVNPDKEGADKYDPMKFEGRWELSSFDGNIVLKDGEPHLHAHCVFSGVQEDGNSKGGHLVEAGVAAVFQAAITRTKEPLVVGLNEEVGIPYLKLANEF